MEFDADALDAIPEIAWTGVRAGRIDWFNRSWYEYTGLAHHARAETERLEREWLAAVHPDDRHLSRQALGNGQVPDAVIPIELRLRRADGISRWFRVQVAQRDPARGGSTSWLGICTDIDDYKRQGLRFKFIAKAGEVLAESLDLQTTLERLLAIIVPEFGDWAAIDLFDENDRLKTAAVIHANPAKMPLLTELLGRYNHDPRVEPRIAAMLRENRSFIFREITNEQLERTADPELLWLIRRLAPRSTVTVPLRSRGRTIGSLVTYWAETPRQYDQQDVPLFEELTKRAAVSIENARLYEREREIAAEFQRASLPISLPRTAGIEFNGIYVPASDRELLGGDWYDALRLADGRIVISIGDVAGSGIAAAVIMSSMRQVIRGVAHVYANPIAILDAADRTLKTEHPETFVTAFVGIFDPIARTLTFASAGHPMPLLRDGNGTVTSLGAAGPPLGLRARGETMAGVKLPELALLVFYTDGLIESERNVIEGQAKVREALSDPDVADSSNPAEALYRSVLKSGSKDDVVVLTLRLYPPVATNYDSLGKSRTCRWTFNTDDSTAARNARHAFVAALRDGGMRDEERDAAELVFGELLGNVVRYAPGPIEVMFDWSEPVPVLHVLDRGPGFTLMPRLPSDLLSERGRGLFIVWSLAEDFNVTERLDGGSHARAVLGTK